MRLPTNEERLKAIRLVTMGRFVTQPCKQCGQYITREKMWKVVRFGPRGCDVSYYYCQNCMVTKEEVLNEVDTDEHPYGIFNVDPYPGFVKKDTTRMHAAGW